MLRFNIIKIILLNIILAASIFSQTNNSSELFFYKKIVLSVEGGFTSTFSDYKNSEAKFILDLSAEYYFFKFKRHEFGARITTGFGSLGGSDNYRFSKEFSTDLYSITIAGNYSYRFHKKFFPFVSLGFAHIWFDPRDDNGNRLPNNSQNIYSRADWNLVFILGLKYRLLNYLTVNATFAYHNAFTDWLDDFNSGSSNDSFSKLTFGVSYLLSENKIFPSSALPGGVNEKIKDSDSDGVADANDKCPDTLPGVKVDGFGCPKDADKDLVPDYLDHCPDTPYGVKVDFTGCPIDSDGDGIPDYLDVCPDTPKGALVDNSGCPMDTDGDKVPDYLDKCPDTPAGVEVNEEGCDKAEDISDKNKIYGEVNFDYGATYLKRIDYITLDELYKEMVKQPLSRWVIEGFCETKEIDEFGPDISLNRAKFVKDYFTRKGIDTLRLEIRAYGDALYRAEQNSEENSNFRKVNIIKVK
ncbi:MAG: outer membrane beta-barrel protein [Chlorobi bacterium]|nr:outer membrane beta-barrel protein [Chlorobiota bacterium]